MTKLTAHATIFIAILAFVCPSPAHAWPETNPDRYAAPSPGTPFEPEAKDRPQAPEPPAGIPEEIRPKAGALSLAELVDAALAANPATRQAWATARARAADWGIARSPYYPTFTENVTGNAGRVPFSLGGSSYAATNLTINYLLLDFGGRGAAAQAARQALLAADFSHNQAIQDVLRDVPQAFYALLGNKALVRAAEASLADARTSLSAAEERRKAGAATLADVLQSRASEEQAAYNLAGAKGAVEISRGDLATVVGWPANAAFDIAAAPEDIPVRRMGEGVDALIERGLSDRPDLNAAFASVKQKEAQLKAARALPFPKLIGSGNFLWQINRHNAQSWAGYGGMGIQVPFFDGFSMHNQARKARAELDAARAALEKTQEEVSTQVWAAHFNFQTAAEQLAAARAVFSSASQSYEVSLGRYKAGAADIVELMNTQGQLANARAQQVAARVNVYSNYAELVHAVGAGFEIPSPGLDETPFAKTGVEEKDESHGDRDSR